MLVQGVLLSFAILVIEVSASLVPDGFGRLFCIAWLGFRLSFVLRGLDGSSTVKSKSIEEVMMMIL